MAPWRGLDRPSSSRGGDVCDHRGQQTHVRDECLKDRVPARLLSNCHGEGQHALEDVLQTEGARIERVCLGGHRRSVLESLESSPVIRHCKSYLISSLLNHES